MSQQNMLRYEQQICLLELKRAQKWFLVFLSSLLLPGEGQQSVDTATGDPGRKIDIAQLNV